MALCLVSCAKKEVSREYLVSYDASSTEIPAGGGSFSLAISWKACMVTVSTSADFVQPSTLNVGSSDGEGRLDLSFIVAPNTDYSSRQARIVFTPTYDSVPGKEILIIQEGLGMEDAVVSLNSAVSYQSWDGFGAMNLGNNWNLNTDWTVADADALLGDMGISIMRIRIPFDEKKWEDIADECRYAYERYGVKILATPWTMPAYMKTPQQIQAKKDGITSSLNPDYYKEYALYLERFAAFMKASGVPLTAISVQNEPDYAAEYDGCLWSAAEHLAFVRDYGHLVRSASLVTAESFSSSQAFYDHVLKDDTACSNFDIVGGHLYGAVPSAYPLAAEKGKRLWMTEHLLNESWTGNTDHWTETLAMLSEINGCMVNGWNAYIWWYGCRYYSLVGDGYEGTSRGEILPRGYAYAQYSRYVRPGDVRIGADVTGPEDLLACAFKGEGRLTAVLVNTGNTAKKVNLDTDVQIMSSSATYTSRQAFVSSLSTEPSGASTVTFIIPRESIATIVLK